MYYTNYNPKKELLKNIIIIGFILGLALFATYRIYYKFHDSRNIDYTSASIDITFHEEDAEEINIAKVTPLTDAVGLSSKGHTFTVTNNLNEPLEYEIKLSNNLTKIKEDNCESMLIPTEGLKVSIKKSGEATKVYNLSELENGILMTTKASPKEEIKYTIRVWASSDSNLPMNSNYHYHGLIQVLVTGTNVAVK